MEFPFLPAMNYLVKSILSHKVCFFLDTDITLISSVLHRYRYIIVTPHSIIRMGEE